jgi:hypothetical protein
MQSIEKKYIYNNIIKKKLSMILYKGRADKKVNGGRKKKRGKERGGLSVK